MAAGLKIVGNELAWNLLGDIGEAAGIWGVSTNWRKRENKPESRFRRKSEI